MCNRNSFLTILIISTYVLNACSTASTKEWEDQISLPEEYSLYVKEIDSMGVKILMIDSCLGYSALEGSFYPYVLVESLEWDTTYSVNSVKDTINLSRTNSIITESQSSLLVKKEIYRSLNEEVYPSFYFESDTVIKCKKGEFIQAPILEIDCN